MPAAWDLSPLPKAPKDGTERIAALFVGNLTPFAAPSTVRAMPQIATTIADVLDALELEPLVFSADPASFGASPYYVEPPQRDDEGDGLPGLGPADRLRQELLQQKQNAKLFLSGHIGAGKSTQINKLAVDPELRAHFNIIVQRIEAGHQAFLDATQLLFLITGAIFDFGKREGLLGEQAKWQDALKDIDAQMFGEKGLSAKQGKFTLDWDFLFVKGKQELAINENKRILFRERGETLRTALLDAIKALVLDIETTLVNRSQPRSLLLLIDDLDKVRGAEQQKDIFSTQLELLMGLPLRVLYTVPTGVIFGSSRAGVRRGIEHLYPVRVLDKSPMGFDPEKAFIPGSDAFFRDILHRRVDPRLFTNKAIELAAIYSGGVLREFFRLLRSAVGIARHNKLDSVDDRALKAAIRDERRRETMGLLASDYEALLKIHQQHKLGSDEDRRYLDEGRVLECYNDKTWYEVNPLLWKVLSVEA